MRIRFKLRTLMILVALVCAGLTWFHCVLQPGYQQRAAVEELKKLGFAVQYEVEWAYATEEQQEKRDWRLLRGWLGDDVFDRVDGIVILETGDRATLHNRMSQAIPILRRLPYPFWLRIQEDCPGAIAMLTDIPNLAGLYVSDADDDERLAELEAVPQLKMLELSSTKITDEGLKKIARLTSLEKLNVRETTVTLEGLKSLRPLVHLKRIALPEIAGSQADEIPKCLEGLGALEAIDFSVHGVPCGWFSDEGLRRLADFPQLRQLSISGTWFTAAGLRELQKLRHLEDLSFDQARLTPDCIRELSQLTSLRTLRIRFCEIDDSVLAEIGKMRWLTLLEIEEPNVTDAGIRELRDLTKLEGLIISNTSMTDASLDVIAAMQGLQYLSMPEATAEAGDGIAQKGVTAKGVLKLKSLLELRSLYPQFNSDPDFREMTRPMKHLGPNGIVL